MSRQACRTPSSPATDYFALAGGARAELPLFLSVLNRYPDYEAVLGSILQRPERLTPLDRQVLRFFDKECRAEGLSVVISTIVDRLKALDVTRVRETADELVRHLVDEQRPDGSWPESLGSSSSDCPRRAPARRLEERLVLSAALAVYALSKWSSCVDRDAGLSYAIAKGRRWLRDSARVDDLWAASIGAQDDGLVNNVPDSSLALMALAHAQSSIPTASRAASLLMYQRPSGWWPKSVPAHERADDARGPGSSGGVESGLGPDVGATALALTSLAATRNWVRVQMRRGKPPEEISRLLDSATPIQGLSAGFLDGDMHPYGLLSTAIMRGTSWLMLQQLNNGGWPRQPSTKNPNGRPRAQVLTTCLVLSALLEACESDAMPTVSHGVRFLLSKRQVAEDGAVFWNSDRRTQDWEQQLSSTALATSALLRVGNGTGRAIADRSMLWLVHCSGWNKSTLTGARLLCSFVDYLRCRQREGDA